MARLQRGKTRTTHCPSPAMRKGYCTGTTPRRCPLCVQTGRTSRNSGRDTSRARARPSAARSDPLGPPELCGGGAIHRIVR